MNNYDRCVEILSNLKLSMRYWGKDVSEFVDRYLKLTTDERYLLSSKVSSELKFDFMCQILGAVNRKFDEYDDNRKKEVLHQAYVLIAFENCEFDYRESLLRVRSLWIKMEAYPELHKEVSGKVAHLAQDNLIKYMPSMK